MAEWKAERPRKPVQKQEPRPDPDPDKGTVEEIDEVEDSAQDTEVSSSDPSSEPSSSGVSSSGASRSAKSDEETDDPEDYEDYEAQSEQPEQTVPPVATDRFVSLSDDERALLEDEEVDGALPSMKREEPRFDWRQYKKLWITLAGVLLALFVGGLIYGMVRQSQAYSAQEQQYQDEVVVVWQQLVSGSQEIKTGTDNLSALEDFDTVEMVVSREGEALRNSITTVSSLTVPERYQEFQVKFAAFLVDYSSYLSQLSRALDIDESTLVAANDRAYSDLIDQGNQLARTAGLMRVESGFIRSSMEMAVFQVLPSNMRRIVQNELARLDAVRQEQEEEEQQELNAEEQRALDRQLAEEAVTGFLDAFMEDRTGVARGFLERSLREEYDLNQDPNNTLTVYEVISGAENQGGDYTFVVRVTFERPESTEEPVSQPANDAPRRTVNSNEIIRVANVEEEFLLTQVDFLEDN